MYISGDVYNNCRCDLCGKEFHRKPSQILKSPHNFCSRDCVDKWKVTAYSGAENHQFGLKGSKNASWKSDKRISRYGYLLIRCLDHPFRTKADFVFEHRLVAEEHLLTEENSVEINGKRYLKKEYVVHHINGVRTDNRVQNLQVMLKGEHSSLHSKRDDKKRKKNKKTGRYEKGRIKKFEN